VQAVFTVALEAVLERHLEGAAPGEIALWSLRGLEVLEPLLQPELRAGTLLLSGPERLLAARPVPTPPPGAPPEAAAMPLAVALAAMFEAAWRTSPPLRRAGAEGMLRSAFEELFNHLDPYSRYMTPEEAQAARVRRVGQAGLGLRLAAGRGHEVVLAAVMPDGPAARAGLQPGDRLLAVDGVPVSARDLGLAATLLEGPAGGEVALRLQRGRRRFDTLLRRSLVPPDSVHAEQRGGILWLRIDGFSNATDRKLSGALLEGIRPGSTRGVVLDLRGNRGGLLGQAVAVASAFLDGGLVAQTAGRHPDAARIWQAGGPDLAEGVPVVVLVDGRSASAAEIVAAALSDRGRAVVVGSATMGKGLIQVVVPLPNGGDLLVTWSRVLAPLGWPIQGLGVLPALCTSLGAEATEAGLARLRRGDPPMAMALARLRAARAPVPPAEVTALRSTCPPAEGRDSDVAAAQALIDAPEAYSAALAR
jgi:carboxyl-terminal processing protease